MRSVIQTLCLSLSLLLLGSAGANSQTVEPTPTPRAPADDGDVVKISTNLIQIDVTVTDSKGNPITDLRADEVEIFENGERQAITNFSFVSGGEKRVSRRREPRPDPREPGIPEPPRVIRPESVGRAMALVVDDLSLSFESAYHTRRALRKFVDEQMQPGDLVAIIRTGAGMGALQQFTMDKKLLHAAIERVKWNPLGSGGTSAFANIEPTPLELLGAIGGSSEIDEEDLQAEREFLDSAEDFRRAQYTTGTLGALQFIINGMGELPGRKSVILFTDGIPLFQRIEGGFSNDGGMIDMMSRLVDAANRASVVVYAVDSRGLQTLGITAADKIISPSPQSIGRALSQRSREMWNSQDGMQYLAKETGGFAILNNNDLASGVRKVMNDQSYYLVGYEPNDETFDPVRRRFNKFEVRVSRPGANVRYRSGFINSPDRETMLAAGSNLSPQQQINDALSSPFAKTEISLSLNPVFGNHPRQGSYVRTLLHVDAKDLEFRDEPNGEKKADIVIVAATFGDNGQLIQTLSRGYTLNVKPSGLAKLLRDGFVYSFSFPVKTPGPVQFRVALRDQQGGKVGSASQFMDVPNLKKGRPHISGIILQGYTPDEWTKVSAAAGQNVSLATDPMIDTSRRRFRVGSILQYGFEVYNARPGPAKRPDVTARIRVFRDGQLIMNGSATPVEPTTGPGGAVLLASGGAIKLADNMEPGDYVLQVIAIDRQAKEKRQLATQFVQFEVVP